MSTETFSFKSEAKQLLNLMIHSLYSTKDIFLRELISNASDALDKLRFESLTDKTILPEGDLKVQVYTLGGDGSKDSEGPRRLVITDNGIGMSREEMINNLGTIAQSGTREFISKLSESKEAQSGEAVESLIGQFGVGFYSAFMVAERISVVTRKAGEKTSSTWQSSGDGKFTIDVGDKDDRGTDVTLYLKKDENEYLEPLRIENIIKMYSDHIGIPIVLLSAEKDAEEKILNTASALWTREKSSITKDQYKEFYHHAAHAYDDPWLTLHNKVEGVLSYSSLLFIPSQAPMDLFNPERKTNVKLYVKRVFITDDCDGLIPPYLRFVKGIVDSEDLPLNISREMFQHNPALEKIKKALTRKILSELKKRSEKEPDNYSEFWSTFGSVLKEGLYEDFENREKLLEIVKFNTTNSDNLVSLDEYVTRMKPGQEAIYYITGEDAAQTSLSPQLEGFKAKKVEVLLLTDPVDEFWLPMVGTYEEKSFSSVTSSSIDLSKIKDAKKDKKDSNEDKEKANDSSIAKLIIDFKETLGESVKDVKSSDRLVESAVCLVAGEGDMDLHLERMLKSQGHVDTPSAARILEINPSHPLIIKLSKMAGKPAQKDTVKSMALILLDEACIIEGQTVSDPSSFSERLNMLLEKSF